MTTPTIIEALKDDQLLGRSGLGEESWSAWHVCLKTIFGLPMEPSELKIFRQHTGRTKPPSKQVKEAWIPTGRRGGKSRVAAAIASYLSCFRSYDEYLSGGEKAYVLLIAADQRQAKVEFGYIRSMLTESPLLSKMIVKELKDSIQLKNNVVVEVRSCNFRTVRGVTTAAVIATECAFWRLELLK